jgi:hypothetical protein
LFVTTDNFITFVALSKKPVITQSKKPMKKGLLFAIGLTAGIGLAAQAPKVSGVKKADLTLSKNASVDAGNFYAQSTASNRAQQNPNAPLAVGTKFSSSRNAFTLLVSQSNCMTANQALNVAMFTHRLSQDWTPDANTASGYVQYTWTTDNGTTWDSTYCPDNQNLGSQRFRYPSGAIFNPSGNTTIGNATLACAGPVTDGSGWLAHYTGAGLMSNASVGTNSVMVHGQVGVTPASFPRVDMQANDVAIWVSGGLYADPNGTTALAQGYRGAALMKGIATSGSVAWTYDSIKPTFHTDGAGANDCFTQAHIAFSPNGMTGYCVFFGVAGGETDPHKRGFQPLTYKSIDGGATWTMLPSFDFTTISEIADKIIPASDNQLHPWFSQSQGSDVVVDMNGNLHIISTIESGSSNDDDSLGYTWTLTGQNGTTARHYVFDTWTSGSGWDSWMVDSIMTTSSDNTTIFIDGSTSTAYATDARIQASTNATHDHIFYTWVDTDPTSQQGENALPDLYGRALDLTTMMATADQAIGSGFTTSQDFYFHYASNMALSNSGVYTLPVSNSIDRDGSHDMITVFDHYYTSVTFPQTSFNVAIGINEQPSAFAAVSAYPNPASDLLNVNISMNNAENVTIEMINTIGQTVNTQNRQFTAGNNQVQINTANLEAGVYFLNITTGNSKSVTKVVVE